MKPAVLEAAILEILAERDNLAPAPERYVMLALTVEFRIKVTFTELRDALSKLDESRHIVGMHGDGTVLWRISDLGRLRLAESR